MRRTIRILPAAAVVAGLFFSTGTIGAEVKKAVERSQIEAKYKWRLEDIYATDEAWEKDFTTVQELIPGLEKYRGTLDQSAEKLLELFSKDDSLGVTLGKLYVYANMRGHENTALDKYQSMSDRASSLLTEYSSATSWVVPEILTVPEDRLMGWLKDSEGLALYRHRLEDILRGKAHTLSPNEEKLLAMAGDVTRMPRTIHSMLDNADMTYPPIEDENGEMVELTKARYGLFMESGDRALRKRAFTAFYETYNKYQNTLASLLSSIVKRDIFYSRARNYDSSLQAALDGDNIPVAVYDNVVSTLSEHMEPMHRYTALRKKVLGLDEVHPYDLYTPMFPEMTREYEYDDAVRIIGKALEPMGEGYLAAMREGFSGGWIDVYETKGKRAGGYSWGSFGTHPYILLNYNGTLNEVFTVAHEMGHALHSHFTWSNQPAAYGDYTIFVAEVASTANEALLMDHMLEVTDDPDEQLSLLDHHVRQIQGTVYIQSLFAEFEREIHTSAENGQPLTADGLGELISGLYKKYFGPELVIDELYKINWGRIPHFYNNFYVYQYATGFAAATLLAEKILDNKPGAREKYLDFLASGSSNYSIELLKKAGVDMTSPEPVEAVARRMDNLLDKMEELIAKRK
jgi:oligoendopeptidase F